MINITIWLAFISGLRSFVSPCVLPLVPAYVGYLANHVTAQVVSELTRIADNFTTSVEVVHNNRFQMALHGLAFVA